MSETGCARLVGSHQGNELLVLLLDRCRAIGTMGRNRLVDSALNLSSIASGDVEARRASAEEGCR